MKNVTELYEELLATFGRETGMSLHRGSEMAVRLYAFATQLYGVYVQNAWTLEQCFPQTARGEFLDRHATLRSLSRLPAQRAQGKLRFSVKQAQTVALNIPQGTICMTVGLVRFETTEAAVLPPDTLFVDVAAQAVEENESGNVPQNTIRLMAVAPLGVSTCTNPAAFLGGSGQEGDEALRLRVLDSYRRMSNGANAAFYEREARSIPGVFAVSVIPRVRGRGTVDVIVAGVQGNPGTAVIAAVQAHLDQQREIAVDVLVKAPVSMSLKVSVTVTLSAGANATAVCAAVRERITAHYDGSHLGVDILRAKLGQVIFSVEGVENYKILTPLNDIKFQPSYLARLDSVTVEVAT